MEGVGPAEGPSGAELLVPPLEQSATAAAAILIDPLTDVFARYLRVIIVAHGPAQSVPFHALPALHSAVKGDLPPIYSGFWATYREIWSVYRRQATDPSFFIDRAPLLPTPTAPPTPISSGAGSTSTSASTGHIAEIGWIDAGPSAALPVNDVIRFDQGDRTFAIYRLEDGQVRASDGLCTHAFVHLCDGLVRDGQIECPKHNGRFDIETGRAAGRPAKVDLRVYNTRERGGRIEICVPE